MAPPAPRAPRQRSYGVTLVRGPFVSLSSHEDAVETADDLCSLAKRLPGPLAVDLFCGAGGLSLGLTAAGFQVVVGVDNDAEAVKTHRAHHPGLTEQYDLSDPDVVEQVGELVRDLGVTLIAGGPPCQPFSKAGRSMIRELVRTGRRPSHDGRRDLWQSFLRVVSIARPPAVLMENVPDMALDRDMLILRTMVDELEALGYSVEERVIDTSSFGVPQFRQRLILVALGDRLGFRWPEPSNEIVTVAAAIGDLPPVEGGWRPLGGADGWAEYRTPLERLTAFQRRARAAVPRSDVGKVFDHITRPVRPDDLVAFDSMDSKTRYSDLDDSLKRYRDDIFDDKYKRLDWDDLSRTITAHIAKDGYWYIHPEQNRTLTVREAARIQTFPDHVRFSGPPSAAFRQIGNAVPPTLGEHLGMAVRSALNRGETAGPSTKVLAERLAAWYRAHEPVNIPWLRADNRWVVLESELLWSRLPATNVATAWASTRALATPSATLDALPLLRRVAMHLGREVRCDRLAETALWFLDHEDALAGPASALVAAPHVNQALADFVVRAIPGANDDPILVTNGAVRVAARFWGSDADKVNRLTDGRLAVARLVGVDEFAGEAHAALIELASGICGPSRPTCNACPLEPWCVRASATPSLPIPTQGQRRGRAAAQRAR